MEFDASATLSFVPERSASKAPLQGFRKIDPSCFRQIAGQAVAVAWVTYTWRAGLNRAAAHRPFQFGR